MANLALQAELMEKEKGILEHQQKVYGLKQQQQTLANHSVALAREKQRCTITLEELKGLEMDHKVYKSVGRLFIKAAVPTLADANGKREELCKNEAERVTGEKQRISVVIESEEKQLNVEADEYMKQMRAAQAAMAAAEEKKQKK
jgi:chaperonin cofactor prefoldin